MYKKNILSFFLVSFFLGITAQAQLIAFPGAEGYGKYASGGRNGKVVEVTNLDDAGEGSLRWALAQHVNTITVYKDVANPNYPITVYDPITIVFKVSGEIKLKTDLRINRDNLTIAGQTAPCDGIVITGRSVLLNGATGGQLFYWGPRRKNVILRHIRFRPGIPLDANGVPTTSFVTYGLDVENYENVIIDHCSMSWANEECLAMYDNKHTTLQWCVISEGLYNAYHAKGLRGYGGVWGGQYASYHHNLIAHQNNRTPRFNGSRAHDTIALIDYRNNINYNWASSSAPYGGEIEIAGGISRTNIINNYLKPGPATPSTHKLIRPDYPNASAPVSRWNVSGNIIDGNATRTANNWLAVDFANIPVASRDSSRSDTTFTVAYPIEEMSAQDAYDSVLKYVGAIYPKRDAVDARIVNEVKTKTALGVGTTSGKAGIIDDPAVVGGLPSYQTCVVADDTDHDGMPDFWESENALDINDPEDRNNVDPQSGYTMLEVYLNKLALGLIPVPAKLISFDASLNQNTVHLNWVMTNEWNNKGFYIERFASTTSSYAWEEIGFVTGSNNSSTTNHYSFTDNQAFANQYQYRLKQVDVSGKISYSKIILVSKSSITSLALSVNPNPAQSYSNIQFQLPQSGKVTLDLFNSKGQLIEQILNTNSAKGNYQRILDLSKYSTGKYILKLQLDGKTVNRVIYKTN
jgi:hypothetical protein